MKRLFLAAAAVLNAIGWSAAAQTQLTCVDGGQEVVLEKASTEIKNWTDAKSVLLSPSVYEFINAEMCLAVRSVAAQSNISIKDIDAGAQGAMTAYLDQLVLPSPSAKPLVAFLEAEFLLGSTNRLPEPKRTAVISFQYTKSVDRMQVGEAVWGAVRMLISEYGAFAFRGSLGSAIVCSGTVEVRSSSGAIVRC